MASSFGFLGIVDVVTKDGDIVTICGDAPTAGEIAYDSDQRRIGPIRRIFGPVERPYVTITNEKPVSAIRKGDEIYLKRGTSNGKDKRGNRRN